MGYFIEILFINDLHIFVIFIIYNRYQYTAEVYPTKIRTTGVGMANGLGRLGGVIMPWICMYLESVDTRSPFILFALLSLTTCVSNFFLPFDTMGKELEGWCI